MDNLLRPGVQSYAAIYEYVCEKCEKSFDHLQRSMSNATPAKCPDCGSTKTSRKLSVFAVGAEGAKSAPAGAPGMCGRCGGPGPCGG